MTSTTPTIQSAALYFREGSSDKEYHAAIEPQGEGYIVTFAYGRRGTTLTTGTKTPYPVSLGEATLAFNKLVTSKLAKGYQPIADCNRGSEPYRQSGNERNDTGIRCQLLNPIEETEVRRLLKDERYCLQEKHDGRRLMVRKQGDQITGINRQGLVIAIPEPIRQAFEEIPFDVLIDGEAVGETLHAFDLLEVKGNDLRERRYHERLAGLLMLIPQDHSALVWVRTAIDAADKRLRFDELRLANREGVVFKDLGAPFSSGRPNSGGPQLKFKFVESASFVVTGHNAKRSVALGMYDGDNLVPAGNVTIPPNHIIPQMGTVVDCQYLHAFRQSGAIYQPVYIGPRSDIPAADCTVDQLKYKPEVNAAA